PPSARRPAATAPPGSAPRPTPTGLARRVPGAQIPVTAPVSLRRSTPSTAAAPLTAGQRSANEVYSFLTQFSDGVRRGLDRP
ncbi:MAG TPA: hypothetical protein VJM49_09430, partial [Acidimicrobiales bacterium]|nr:hypothetical protein [Acidimicrobiales bacterium]